MPIFRVDLNRHVSRSVELRQTCHVFVEAKDSEQAREAATLLRWNCELGDWASEWMDVNSSRASTDDEVVKGPRVSSVLPVVAASGGPVYDATKEGDTQ